MKEESGKVGKCDDAIPAQPLTGSPAHPPSALQDRLKQIMAELQRVQPLDPLQNLIVFRNGNCLAVFQFGAISFGSLGELEALADYAAQHQPAGTTLDAKAQSREGAKEA